MNLLRRRASGIAVVVYACLLLGGCSGSGGGGAGPSASGQLKNPPLEISAVAVENFHGIGAEWDPQFWADFNLQMGVTEGDWQTVINRIRWMRLPVVRMMMQLKWVTRGDGVFDWETPAMKSMYRHLDVCQQQNITIYLTEWQRRFGSKVLFGGVDSPRYAEAIGTCLDYLINVRGYTCIKYFILSNEPNLGGGDWARWKTGVANVARVIADRKLPVQVVGTDESLGDDWHRRGVDEMAGLFDVWEVHQYVSRESVRNGLFEQTMRQLWDYPLARDPDVKRKFFMIGETGMLDGMHNANLNDYIDTYDYGVFMADLAVQATRAGTGAITAWMLEESSHPDFNWGLWKNKKGNFALKPWFYTWSLLVRNFLPGSTVYRIDPLPANMRGMAAQTPSPSPDTGPGWSFCLVNRDSSDSVVTVRVPAAGTVPLKRYVYSRASAVADADGFPLPVEVSDVDLAAGVEVNVPADAVVILTTLP
jgi:hypothetical protein